MLISECLFDVLSFPKTNTKIWQISALEYKSDEINKIKALFHKVEKILKDSLDSIPSLSPSVKIQKWAGKFYLIPSSKLSRT